MKMLSSVNYSYWELKHYFDKFDYIVVGSGIVGLNVAFQLKKFNHKSKVLILEKGVLPSGASTKNAGFACFGSSSELLDDISSSGEALVWETVKMRWEGLKLLKKNLGEKNLAYQPLGGTEWFSSKLELEACLTELDFLNNSLRELLGINSTFKKNTNFVKAKMVGAIKNKYEGQLDTSLMMHKLLSIVRSQGVEILNNVEVNQLRSSNSGVQLETNVGVFKSKKCVVAINGFSSRLLKIKDVKPARAQVLVTKPIKNLKLKGAFHFDKGYYYFRNIDNRVLLGGARNMDFKTETTDKFELNPSIQKHLDDFLRTAILPGMPYEIDHRWCGIMGVGSEKKPIIEFVDDHILAAVRMGGMGVAIGSLVGLEAAKRIIRS
ncbi:MAG: NAD(P)/FAD-dependent oxidoreductase [Bacteroidota bacterium]